MRRIFEGPQLSQFDCHKTVSAKLKTDNFKVLKYEQIAFEEINGFLGEHCSLEVTIERNSVEETFSFFVKFPPRVKSQRNFLDEINGIFKEKSFFTNYLPQLKKHGIDVLEEATHCCYHIAEDIFIFEDLKARGYDTLSSRTPLNLSCVKAALSTFAQLHASGLILEETKSFRLTENFQVELKESFYSGKDSAERAIGSAKQGLRALIDITHQDNMRISKDLFKDKAVEGCDLQKVFTKPSNQFRNTICHADPWTKNFLFKFEGGRVKHCVIVDFQTYRYGPPAQDVLSFIHLVTDRKLRDGHLDEILEFYYEELRGNIEKYGFKDVVTRKEFFESCVYFKQFSLTQTLTHFQVVILSDEIATELFGDQERAQLVLFGGDRYDFIKMACQRDELFKERNLEAIADLREFYEKQLFEEEEN